MALSNFSTLIVCWLFTLCAIGYSETNNAGSQYHGKSNKWSNISLITSDKAPWVHFVYMIADNNLDSFGVSDLEEMRLNNASVNNISIVVYVDRCFNCDDESSLETVNEIYDYYTKEPINGKFNGSKILQRGYDSSNDKFIWYQMMDFGHELDSTLEINIGNFTKLLEQFEESGNTLYYALTFWDHGGAWSGYGSDDNTANSTGVQASTLSKLFTAISDGLEETYIGRLDLLGFDACIMADYSVLHSIDGSITQYYIASEVSEPGEGWDYTGLMPVNVTTGNVNDPINYGIAIIDSYVYQTDQITTKDYGAGYTLALFDMDQIEYFKNSFDSLVKMMTLPVINYDYGILMSILRGKSDSIAAEEDFYIYDLGLFLDGLIDNIFFQTCPTRFINIADNVMDSWDEALLYFDADFLRSDLTGASIFYATNASSLNLFTYYNSDLASDNYVEFLEAVSNSLKLLQANDGSSLLTNNTCHMPIPNNLTFYLSNINIDYNQDYNLFKIRADCGQTVMSSETEVYLHLSYNDSDIDIGIASIDTNIDDVSLAETQLEVFWDGKIALFMNDNTTSSNVNESSYILSTSTIQYYFSSDDNIDVPIGYTVEYPVKMYSIDDVKDSNTNEITLPTIDDTDGLYSASNASEGYLQIYVLINESFTNEQITQTMTLYEINEEWGVIGEVSSDSSRIIIGDASYMINENTTMSSDFYGYSYLVWPNISVYMTSIWDSEYSNDGSLDSAVIMTATDVLGTTIEEYIVVDNSTMYSTWAPETDTGTTEASSSSTASTSMPMSTSANSVNVGTTEASNSVTNTQEATSMASTNVVETTNGATEVSSGSGSTSEAETGLDAVSGGAWLAIVLVLAAALIGVTVLYCREKALRSDNMVRGSNGDDGYLQMTEN